MISVGSERLLPAYAMYRSPSATTSCRSGVAGTSGTPKVAVAPSRARAAARLRRTVRAALSFGLFLASLSDTRGSPNASLRRMARTGPLILAPCTVTQTPPVYVPQDVPGCPYPYGQPLHERVGGDRDRHAGPAVCCGMSGSIATHI